MTHKYIVPGAAGDLTEIESQTPDSGEHWDKVVISDGDTTKVHTTQPEWQHDIYRITPDLVSGTERCPIASVRIYMTGRGTAPVNGSKGEHLIKTYGVVYPSGTVPALGVSYSSYYKTWTTNPHTGEAWTWSEVTDENFQIGVRIKASREYGVYESAITRVRIRVAYTPVLVAVTTQAVTEKVGTTATGNGTLVDLGGETPYQHGHCWSTSPNPTTSDSKTQNGYRGTPGTFTSSITDLIPGTLYYCRAYAINSAGTSYGAEVEFTTTVPVILPTVTTNPATGQGAIAATLNGTLADNGGEDCECGLEWGPDVDKDITTPTESKTTGEAFSQVIGGLTPNTTYHFRAFATNSEGTGYGADMTFTTALIISRAFALSREEL